jgi:hypothetical protein
MEQFNKKKLMVAVQEAKLLAQELGPKNLKTKNLTKMQNAFCEST